MSREEALQNNKTVDRFTQEKLYIQLMRIFLDMINSENWQLGQQIPTEEDLCKKYNVSKITVRQAINNLVSDGYLIKIQGKGTFVAIALPVVGLAMKTRLTEEMFGKEVNVEKKVLFRGIKKSFQDAKDFLKTEDNLYYVLNKKIVNGETVCLEESFVPYHFVPKIESIDFTNNALYAVLQDKCVKKIFKIIQTIDISRADMGLAKRLEMRKGGAILVVHRLFLSSDGSPVAYTRFRGRNDRYKFQTEFERIR